MVERGTALRSSARARTVDPTFACDVLNNLALVAHDHCNDESLVLPLSLSLSMRRSDITTGDAIETLLALRCALVRSAGLDEASDSIPLLHADDRTSLLTLAHYLVELLVRAASASGASESEIVDRALGSLPPAPNTPRLGYSIVALTEVPSS